MMRYRSVGAFAVAAIAGALVSALVVEQTVAPSTTTVRTVVRPVTVNSGQSASNLRTTGKSVNQIYNQNSPGVVEIVSTIPASSSSTQTPFSTPSSGNEQAQGTGFEIDDQGDIVTNAHVVSGATSIRVTTKNHATYDAKLVGSDPTTDVAVIRITASPSSLSPLEFANSNGVKVGDAVVAIGDPFGLTNTVTAGIVSALNRTITSPNNHPITGAIQTDAAINHGNSGGPLLNADGQVIGITSQIETGDESSSSGNDGVGFAVASNTVVRIAHQLIQNGKASHPFLGVYLGDTTTGAVVAKVVAGSPAAKAGIKEGDVIVKVAGRTVHGPEAVITNVGRLRPGATVAIEIRRNGQPKTLQVTIGSMN
jgi:putative serine protease PepD